MPKGLRGEIARLHAVVERLKGEVSVLRGEVPPGEILVVLRPPAPDQNSRCLRMALEINVPQDAFLPAYIDSVLNRAKNEFLAAVKPKATPEEERERLMAELATQAQEQKMGY